MAFDLMIVDDSPAMRRFIRRVIDLSGFDMGKTYEAGDGIEALQVVESNPVDAILTDINMPRMDGEAFLEALRDRPEGNAIPVIVVSTDATDSRMERMVHLGAQGYVTKPFAPERLRAELEKVLGPETAGMVPVEGEDEFSF